MPGGYTVGRYVCTVNQVGPASDGTETPAPVVYINLTDTAGSFEDSWFYAADGIQQQLLDVGIAAITQGKDVAVEAAAPEPGNSQFPEVSRLFGFVPPVAPVAPTDFHEISLSPPTAGTIEHGLLVIGWQGNFDNEISFNVHWQTPDLSPGSQSAGPNSTTASVSLPAGFTYDVYVTAVNSAGESAPSNTITVTVPYVQPTPASATLLAAVGALPQNIVNFGLMIQGRNFGANETVAVIVEWTVGEESPDPVVLDPPSTDLTGFFEVWFTGDIPDGLCPILVAFGQSQPPQYFSVSAEGQSSGRTASTSTGPFTCPDTGGDTVGESRIDKGD